MKSKDCSVNRVNIKGWFWTSSGAYLKEILENQSKLVEHKGFQTVRTYLKKLKKKENDLLKQWVSLKKEEKEAKSDVVLARREQPIFHPHTWMHFLSCFLLLLVVFWRNFGPLFLILIWTLNAKIHFIFFLYTCTSFSAKDSFHCFLMMA